jgi:hypothetical protein
MVYSAQNIGVFTGAILGKGEGIQDLRIVGAEESGVFQTGICGGEVIGPQRHHTELQK